MLETLNRDMTVSTTLITDPQKSEAGGGYSPGDQRTPVTVERADEVAIAEVTCQSNVGDGVAGDVASPLAPEPDDFWGADQGGKYDQPRWTKCVCFLG